MSLPVLQRVEGPEVGRTGGLGVHTTTEHNDKRILPPASGASPVSRTQPPALKSLPGASGSVKPLPHFPAWGPPACGTQPAGLHQPTVQTWVCSFKGRPAPGKLRRALETPMGKPATFGRYQPLDLGRENKPSNPPHPQLFRPSTMGQRGPPHLPLPKHGCISHTHSKNWPGAPALGPTDTHFTATQHSCGGPVRGPQCEGQRPVRAQDPSLCQWLPEPKKMPCPSMSKSSHKSGLKKGQGYQCALGDTGTIHILQHSSPEIPTVRDFLRNPPRVAKCNSSGKGAN